MPRANARVAGGKQAMGLAVQSYVIGVRDLRVLVTAGASGIGRAIAEAFVSGGSQVHITDISEAAINDAVTKIAGLSGTPGDAADPHCADRVLAEIRERFDGLDVLVNNVGVAGPTGGVETYADQDVGRTIDVNLKSHFYFLNRFVPLLQASPANPSIIAMSSVAGRLGYGLRTPYAATKWAIVGLVQSLAVELGPQGVRVRAVSERIESWEGFPNRL